jgi:hypothetical protein
LSADELRLTNLVTTAAVADVLPQRHAADAAVAALPKPVQDRFVNHGTEEATLALPVRSTQTAEASVPTGGVAAPAQK